MSRNKLGLFSDCTFAGAFIDAMDVATRADGRHPTSQKAEISAEPQSRPKPQVRPEPRWQRPIQITIRPLALAKGFGAATVVLGVGLAATWLV